MALDDYGWQVAGRKVELTVEDGATNSTVSHDKAVKMVEREKVSFICSPLQQEIQAVLAPYLEKHKVFLIGMRTMGEKTVDKYKYVFAPSGGAAQFAYTMGLYAYDKLGYRTATMISPDVACSYDIYEAFKKSFEGKGGKILQAQYHPFMAVDFASYITAMKAADACVTWNPAPGQLRFISQYGEMGMFKKMPIIASFNGGTFEEQDLHRYGDICIGIRGNNDWSWNADTPGNKKFMAAYKNKYREEPRSPSYGAYRAIQVILETIKVTGGDTTPEKLLKAMSNLKISTPTGVLRFTPGGIGIFDIYITENIKVGDVYQWKIVDRYPEVIMPSK